MVRGGVVRGGKGKALGLTRCVLCLGRHLQEYREAASKDRSISKLIHGKAFEYVFAVLRFASQPTRVVPSADASAVALVAAARVVAAWVARARPRPQTRVPRAMDAQGGPRRDSQVRE